MKITEQIDKELKLALKEKDEIGMSVLRMVKSALHNQEISLKKKELPDQEVIKVLNSEAKKRKDSVESYKKGGRTDLAKQEEEELAYLSKYLPEQLSEEEVRKIVDKVIAKNPDLKNPQAFGRVMGQVMGQVGEQADGKLVQKIVTNILNE